MSGAACTACLLLFVGNAEGRKKEGGGGCGKGDDDMGEGERARGANRLLFGFIVLLIARGSAKARVNEGSRGYRPCPTAAEVAAVDPPCASR